MSWSEALLQHWPEYLMEAGLLGGFMISACMFATLLEHPGGRGRRAVSSAFARRALTGVAMGLTAVTLIYSPWGQQSGAHMNPATTLTFFLRGKVAAWDATFYVAAQFVGGAAGVAAARFTLRDWLRHESVNHVVTTPGRHGVAVAWIAELLIAFGMMFMVLNVSNDALLTPYTGLFAGTLVALYITFEAPLSGMSLNPARTFGSALLARHWKAFWVYLTAPVVGMLMASAAYAALPVHHHVYCAKLDHCNDRRCIFRCEFDQLRK
ncbi:MAG: aquaporin [Phycisphaerales bacterium]|nr:aquaporin [Phycisphaerales bacterium]